MQQNTFNKLQEILKQQQAQAAKVNPANFSGKTGNEKKAIVQAQATPPAATQPAPAPKPQPKRNAEKIALKLFTIDGNEGRNDFSGRTVNTWQEATNLLLQIGCPSLGYNKTWLTIIWADDTEFKPRIDVGSKAHDFNAGHKSIGEFIKRWFEPEELEKYQFEDEPEAIAAIKPEAQEPAKISVILPEDNKPPQIVEKPASSPETTQEPEFEESPLTFADLMNEKQQAKTAQPAKIVMYTAPKPPATPAPADVELPALEMVRYSAKSIAIFGKRTKELRAEIRDLGGKFNAILNYKETGTRQAGWIFFYTPEKEEELKQFIEFFI